MALEKRELGDLLLLRLAYTIGSDTVADTKQITPLESPFEITRVQVVNEEDGTPDQAKYVFVYDTAGTPIVGTSDPVLQFPVPQEATGANKGVAEVACPDGMKFENGLAFAIAFTNADTDATSISGASSDVVTVSFYGRKL